MAKQTTLVALRIFDGRRFGMLFQRYRRSKVWTLPCRTLSSTHKNELDLVLELFEEIPKKNSEFISAVTLFENSENLTGVDNEETVLNSLVYDVTMSGKVLLTSLPYNIDRQRFVPYARLDVDLPSVNHITSRFIRAMRKQECLR